MQYKIVIPTIISNMMALSGVVAAEGNTTPSGVLEEVVVTATKRAQNLQDIPVAVTAFSESSIAALNIQSAMDLNAPNFLFPQIFTTVRNYISIRGIFQEVNTLGTESGFSNYIDGVYMGRNMSFDASMFDIERVEILRGPQGTLFGKNTIGGLMNIVTKKPSSEFGGNIQLDVGNYNLRRGRFGVNVPLVDDVLATRVSLQKVTRDGYVDNLSIGGPKGGDTDLLVMRGQLLFTPNDKFSAAVSVDYLDSDGMGYTNEIVASESTPTSYGDDTPHTYHPNRAPLETKEDGGVSLTIDYEFKNGNTLTSITGLRRTKTQWIYDDDASQQELLYEDIRDQQDLWSQELRIASATGSKFDYVVGLYYYDERAKNSSPIPLGPDYFGPLLIYYNGRFDTEDFAVFGHLDAHVTDALTVYGGVRYTDETKNFEGERRAFPIDYEIPSAFIPGLTTDGTGMPPQFVSEINSEEVTWEAGLQYNFTPDVMSYAEVSTGFKSGGFSTRDGLTVDPEYVTTYEIGAKTTFQDNRLSLNVAAFYNDYEDLQVRSLDIATGAITVVLQNAANVIAKGAEVEVLAAPVENLNLRLGIGYVDSTYDEFRNVSGRRGAGILDLSGNHLPMTPPWTISGGVNYQHPLADGGTLVFDSDFNFIDSRWSALDAGENTPDFALPSYAVLNGRAGYVSPDGKWELFIWAKNITDKVSPVDRRSLALLGPSANYPEGLDFQFATYTQPRTFGVNLLVNF